MNVEEKMMKINKNSEKREYIYLILLLLLLGMFFVFCGCGKAGNEEGIKESSFEVTGNETDKSEEQSAFEKETGVDTVKVTFIEIGSLECVPCKMMQPIMEEIEDEYKEQVEVVFYDVWTDEGSPYAQKYDIKVIPTQIFLDKDGNEYFRHEGYFPKDDLVKVLKMQGVE